MLEKIALQKNLITKDQCLQALEACRGAKNMELALKDYFVTQKIIPPKQMKHLVSTFYALKTMQKNNLFGTVAMKLGMVEKKLFIEEVARQKKEFAEKRQPKFIGEIWVKKQVLTREQYQQIIQYNQTKSTPAKVQEATAQPDATNNDGQTNEQLDRETEVSPVDTQPEQSDEIVHDYSLKQDLPGGLILEIDAQAMNAFLQKKDEFKDTITPSEILEHLTEYDIFFGIVKENDLQGFIDSSGFKTNKFKVASGRKPKPGKNARIEYYFDTDHLKAGGMDEEGNVDFKDRGVIPWVEEGVLLAEKFPMTEAVQGRNIFDQVVEVPLVTDTTLRFKTGVICSEDDLKLFSEISGHPKLDLSGNIQVTETFVAPKDVNYQTGHLDYSGNVVVKGTLKAGFMVRGEEVRINTVDGGDIYAKGDVIIINGANDARIYTRGNIKAKFIQNSEIFCLGNLTVDKEIVDSRIETSGSVTIPNGEVISSKIKCNKGLVTRHLGTDKSVPNVVTLGVDAFTTKELKAIRKKIAAGEQKAIKFREKIESLKKDTSNLRQATTRLAHELDRARDEGLALQKKQQELKKDTKKSVFKSQIQSNNALFARLDKDLNRYFDRIEKNESLKKTLTAELEQLEDRLEDLRYEMDSFNEWLEENPGVPEAVVAGRISPGTVVKGRRATREITEMIANVKVKETLSSEEEGAQPEIRIHDNIKR
ncbi:MAG: FapA family protein [Desulfobacterales bacterium]|nr:FapA family protein [Desulfobacterales bacterium]